MIFIFLRVLRLVVDLDFVAVVHRHPLLTRLDRNSDEDARVVIVVAHFINHADLTIAQLSASPIKQSHAAVSANQAVLNGHVTGTDMLPAGQVLPIKELLPIVSLGVNKRGQSQYTEDNQASVHASPRNGTYHH